MIKAPGDIRKTKMAVSKLNLSMCWVDAVFGSKGVTGESQCGDSDDGVFFHRRILNDEWYGSKNLTGVSERQTR